MTHPPEFTDTDPKAMEAWVESLRRKTPGERLGIAFQLTEIAFRMSEAGVRLQFPEASDREVFLRAAARRLPRDLMIAAYGWDPEGNGEPR